MNKDAWYQYFTECEAVTDRNAELVEEKFKECEAYTEKVLKKKYPECARLHVYESNNIRVSGYPLPLKLKIVDDLTIDNPAYLKAKYQRRPTWGIDQKLQLFTYDNDGTPTYPI